MKLAFSALRAEIAKQFPFEGTDLLAQENVAILSLDRALSPAGDRRLKDARVLMSQWPNPAVYRMTQLTERIVFHIERKTRQAIQQPTLSMVECIELFRRMEPSRRLRHLYARILQFKQLHPSAAHLDRWAEVIREYESAPSLDLKEWSEILIDFLRLRMKSAESKSWLSSWQSVSVLLDNWSEVEALSTFDWHEILERDPNLSEPLKILVIESREAYALEATFLKALGELKNPGAPKLLKLKIESSSALAIEETKHSEFSAFTYSTTLDADSAIFWATPETIPSTIEAIEWIPGTFPLDLATDESAIPHPELKELFNFANYRKLNTPNKHSWLLMNHSKKLRLTKEQSPSQTWEQFLRLFEAEQNHIAKNLQPPKTFEDLEDWFFIFLELGVAPEQEVKTENLHPRIQNNGVPLLSIHDLLYSPDPKKILWGSSVDLENLCNPYAAGSHTHSLLPSQLEDCFEAAGIVIPKVSREMEKLRSILRLLKSELSFLQVPQAKMSIEAVAPLILKPYEKEKPSPTAMESYLKCGLKFYFERVLRLEDSQAPDPERVQDNLKGKWIHKVLELAFKNPQGPNAANVPQLFEETLDEIFQDRVSEAYKSLLIKQSRAYAESLSRHLENFEAKLSKFYPQKTCLLEHPVEGIFQGQLFRGLVDRIDQLGNGQLLVWDYKSNDQSQKMPTLIKNNAFQWYLYKKIIEGSLEFAGSKVIGGGYLNPMNPEKSRIVLWQSTTFEAFEEILSSLKYPNEIFSSKETELCDGLLSEKIAAALSGLKSGNFSPMPIKEAECTRCRFTGICGRPYLLEDQSP